MRRRPRTPRNPASARGEHVFGHIAVAMNGCFVRTIGMARGKAKIGRENLAYNLSRFVCLMSDHARTAHAA